MVIGKGKWFDLLKSSQISSIAFGNNSLLLKELKKCFRPQNRLILCEYCEQPFSTLEGKSCSTILQSALSSARIGRIFFPSAKINATMPNGQGKNG